MNFTPLIEGENDRAVSQNVTWGEGEHKVCQQSDTYNINDP